MPGSNQRRTLAVCIRVTVIISLTIAAVAVVTATFLYVVFGQQAPETPKPVYDPKGDRPVANTRAASGERLIPGNRSSVEYLPPNRRSMDGRPKASIGIRLPLADSGIHDMSASRNRYPNNHRYGTSDGVVASPENYDETDVTFDAKTQQNFNRQINHFEYSNLETDNWTTEKDGSTGYHDSSDLTYNIGAYNNKQTDDLAGINELHREPVVELDPYYSTINGPYYNRPSGSQPIIDHQPLSTDYKLPSKSYQPPTTNYQLPSSNYQLPNMNYYRPTDMIYQPPSTNYNTPSKNYEPPKTPQAPQKPNLDSVQQKIETPIPSTSSVVDWRLLGLLSLIKLGIVKLKSIVIIKTLLFLVFSLKLLLITIFFKFLLLFKFFKAVILPFLFIPLLLTSLIFPMILSSLFSIPGRIIRYLFTPNNAINLPAMMPSMQSNILPSTPGIMVPNTPGTIIPNVPGTIIPNTPGTIIPNTPGTMVPNTPGILRPGFVPFVPRPGTVERPAGIAVPANQAENRPGMTTLERQLGHFPINKNGTTSTKSDTLHLPYGSRSESSEASYPIMDVFWKIIDSEKCVERLACRMAVTEEAGTIPIFINWAMRVVSKFIPNKQIELYFKTYDDIINNEVLTSHPMRTSDSWNSWCLEHYNCKSNNA